MKKVKKLFAVVFSLFIAFSVVLACGDDDGEGGSGCPTSGSCDMLKDDDCCVNESTISLCMADGTWKTYTCGQGLFAGSGPVCKEISGSDDTCVEAEE